MSLNPLLCIGTGIAVLITSLAGLSYSFPYGVDLNDAPLFLYVGLALLTCGVWCLLPGQIKRPNTTQSMFIAAILIGLVMRGSMFLSLPVMEDDSYRYLWDGAVTANGIDPYKYAPAEAALEGPFETQNSDPIESDLIDLQTLASTHSDAHSRINYPYVSTIYPPLAQAAFAVAYRLDPFGLNGWRWVLLTADLIAFALLVKLLAAYKRDRLWALIYWWNPIVVLHGFGAGHMDLLILPFLIGALLLAQQRKINWAVITLAGAGAVKLWPALLLPMIMRPLLRRPVQLVLAGGLFVIVTAIALLPQIVHALDPQAGLNAYAVGWRTHAFIFAILEDVVLRGLDEPGLIARIVVMVSVIGLTAYLALSRADDLKQLPALCAAVIASLILLSPTGYPWYLIWLAPFLAFVPNAGLRALFATAPLYWLRFELGDTSILHQWVIVPVAFGVPILLLFLPFLNRAQNVEGRHHHSRIK